MFTIKPYCIITSAVSSLSQNYIISLRLLVANSNHWTSNCFWQSWGNASFANLDYSIVRKFLKHSKQREVLEVLNNRIDMIDELTYFWVMAFQQDLTEVPILALKWLQREEVGCQTLQEHFCSLSWFCFNFPNISDQKLVRTLIPGDYLSLCIIEVPWLGSDPSGFSSGVQGNSIVTWKNWSWISVCREILVHC